MHIGKQPKQSLEKIEEKNTEDIEMDESQEEEVFRRRTRKGRNFEASQNSKSATLQGEESIEDQCSQRAVEASLE